MSSRNRRTREEKIKLLEDYEISRMSPKDYAQLKGIGLSTFHKWSLQLRGPLRERDEKASAVESNTLNSNSSAFSEEKGRKEINKQDALLPSFTSSLSFIDITSQLRKEPHQASQSLESCGLEIRLPNGVMLKLEKVPFHHAWDQVIEWVRELS